MIILSLGIGDIQTKVGNLESVLNDTKYPSWIDALVKMFSGVEYGEDELLSEKI